MRIENRMMKRCQICSSFLDVSSDSVANLVHLREAGLITCWNRATEIVGILSGFATKQLATILLYRTILQVGELWKNVLYSLV